MLFKRWIVGRKGQHCGNPRSRYRGRWGGPPRSVAVWAQRPPHGPLLAASIPRLVLEIAAQVNGAILNLGIVLVLGVIRTREESVNRLLAFSDGLVGQVTSTADVRCLYLPSTVSIWRRRSEQSLKMESSCWRDRGGCETWTDGSKPSVREVRCGTVFDESNRGLEQRRLS